MYESVAVKKNKVYEGSPRKEGKKVGIKCVVLWLLRAAFFSLMPQVKCSLTTLPELPLPTVSGGQHATGTSYSLGNEHDRSPEG